MPALNESFIQAKGQRRPATSSQVSQNREYGKRNPPLPGPGQYNTTSTINSQQLNSRKSTMGSRFNQIQIQTGQFGPGPSYKPGLTVTNVSKPAYNIGGKSQQRPDTLKFIQAPGPDTYFSSTEFGRGQLSKSAKRRKLDLTPKKYGVEAVKEKTPAWTFAKSTDVVFGQIAD